MDPTFWHSLWPEGRSGIGRHHRLFDGSGYSVTMVRYKHDLRQSMRTYFEVERPTINNEAGS